MDDDMSSKKNKKYQILQTKNLHLTKKIKHLEDHHSSLTQNYGQKIADKQISAEEASERIRKLEDVESALIDRLKHTHNKQQNAYKDLEKVVHDGYGYYLHSFKEKRERNQSLYNCGSKSTMKTRNESILNLNSQTQNHSIKVNHSGN